MSGFGYNEDVRWADQYFQEGVTLSATAVTSTNALKVGAHNGSLALKVAANGEVALTAASTINVDIYECDTEDGTFTIHAKMPNVTLTAPTGGLEYADGEVLMAMVLPDCMRFVKIRITGTAATDGDVDLYLDYLAR